MSSGDRKISDISESSQIRAKRKSSREILDENHKRMLRTEHLRSASAEINQQRMLGNTSQKAEQSSKQSGEQLREAGNTQLPKGTQHEDLKVSTEHPEQRDYNQVLSRDPEIEQNNAKSESEDTKAITEDLNKIDTYCKELYKLDKWLNTTIDQLKGDEKKVTDLLETQKYIAKKIELRDKNRPEARSHALAKTIKEWGLEEWQLSQLSNHSEEENTGSTNIDVFSQYLSPESAYTPYSLDHFCRNLEKLSRQCNTWTDSIKSSSAETYFSQENGHKKLMRELLNIWDASNKHLLEKESLSSLDERNHYIIVLQGNKNDIIENVKSYLKEYDNLFTTYSHIETRPRRTDFENTFSSNKKYREKLQNISRYSKEMQNIMGDHIAHTYTLLHKDEVNQEWEDIKPKLRDLWIEIKSDIQPGFKQTNSDLQRITEQPNDYSHNEVDKSLKKYIKRVEELNNTIHRIRENLESISIPNTEMAMEFFQLYTFNAQDKIASFLFSTTYERFKATEAYIQTWKEYTPNTQPLVDGFYNKLSDIVENLPDKDKTGLIDLWTKIKIDIQPGFKQTNLDLQGIKEKSGDYSHEKFKEALDKCKKLSKDHEEDSDYDLIETQEYLEECEKFFKEAKKSLDKYIEKAKEFNDTMMIIVEKLRLITTTDTNTSLNTLKPYIMPLQEKTKNFLSSVTLEKSKKTEAYMQAWKKYSHHIESYLDRLHRELSKFIDDPNNTEYFNRLSSLPEHLSNLDVN